MKIRYIMSFFVGCGIAVIYYLGFTHGWKNGVHHGFKYGWIQGKMTKTSVADYWTKYAHKHIQEIVNKTNKSKEIYHDQMDQKNN